jgi:hypothetical protein
MNIKVDASIANGVLPIPSYLLTPDSWAREAIIRANEYLGMPEGQLFLIEARRYLALNARIKELEESLAGDMNALGTVSSGA